MDGGDGDPVDSGNVAHVAVFRADEALKQGVLTRHELAAYHRRLFPGVYADKRTALSLNDRIVAAWLWSRRRAVICGLAASALHGAKWVHPGTPIELNFTRDKFPAGVTVYRDTLLTDEIAQHREMAVTTVARTAFDLARRLPLLNAVQHLDSLGRATRFRHDDVIAVAAAHPRVRGRRRLARLLDLMDAGAQSPKETWLRLLLIDAGFPRPQTQIPLLAPDGFPLYFLDMGWEDIKVAVEYDGEQHRTDIDQYRTDVIRAEYLDGLGWRRIRVLAGHRPDDIVRRVARAGVPRNVECAAVPGFTHSLSA